MVGFDAAAAAIAADAEPEWKPDPTWKVEFLFVSTPKEKWNEINLDFLCKLIEKQRI